jgi:hypothetical protein
MLLRCGDAFDENFGGGIGLSGRSNTERMLLSSYGTGPRPQIRSGSGNGFNIWGNGDGNNMALVGLHFWPNTYDGRTARRVASSLRSGRKPPHRGLLPCKPPK